MCWRRNSRVWAPASARVSSASPDAVEQARVGVHPDDDVVHVGELASVAWTTRSGPSATISRSSSVMSVAISTITWRAGSRPVISRSIHASIPANVAALTSGAVAQLQIPVVRLDPDLPLPAYAHPGDAGADLVAREDAVLAAGGGRALIPTGVAIALPEGWAGFVQPRSGLALRHGVTVLNSPGLIDAGYRDELKVILVNTDPDAPYQVHRGDRIAQLVIQPWPKRRSSPWTALPGRPVHRRLRSAAADRRYRRSVGGARCSSRAAHQQAVLGVEQADVLGAELVPAAVVSSSPSRRGSMEADR